ncbi:MAG: Fe-S cluster assembly protein HesB [Actinomycetota bacterium]
MSGTSTGRPPIRAVTTLELPLVGPGGEPVDLARTVTSHGFAELAPMSLDETSLSLELTVRVPGGRPRRVMVVPGRTGFARIDVLGPGAGARVRTAALTTVANVLRLDQDLSGFYERITEDPDLSWAAAGAGRMLRSPTVFEDILKTVCTTNCAWSATVRMVNGLVAGLGEPAVGGTGPLTNAFPTPAAVAAASPGFFRDAVRAGYRGPYMIELARRVDAGEVDPEPWASASPEELPDDELERALLDLPGVGPYAAAHVMMTLGRNSRLILDSWTRPKYARLTHRTKPVSDAAIRRRFRRYGGHAGLAFWLFLTRDWLED